MDVIDAFRLSAEEQNSVNKFVHDFNSKLNPGRKPQQNLGKDDFLKILITQLSYQDPTAPMEDKEFIAQLAQFSSLEQMTSMAADFARLTSLVTGTEASSALGKSVELTDGDRTVQGAVKAISRGDNPQVLVNGVYYNWNQVHKVFEE
ncbi:MAG: flagellar hook assembly protein FlgD [Treponema sp.]|jgi:flagellar basal-body rod modification protein FlgD|nr:flagellar hook assembly protein FlgD [Treponema sp.]